MIGQVQRITTVFANMMLAASLALAITIGVAGTVERTSAGCYGCLTTSVAIAAKAGKPATAQATGMRLAFGTGRIAGTL